MISFLPLSCLTLTLMSSIFALPLSSSYPLLPREAAAPAETSVYVCQNYDWTPPCLLITLGPSNNGQQDFWMAPAPGGPGPFRNGNYTVGSWGPSQGVTTYWVDSPGNKSAPLTYPGTGRVDEYWGSNIWTWWPSWEA